MIIRSRRENDSLVKRMFRSTFSNKQANEAIVYSPAAFLLELAKETARANRRAAKREFALISLQSQETQLDHAQFDAFITDVRERLRIYDVIGWFDDKLSILLPETARDDAYLVANEIIKIGGARDFVINAEVRVYPWDDELSSVSEVLKPESKNNTDDDGNPDEHAGLKHGEFDVEQAELVSAQLATGLDDASTQGFSAIDLRANMIGFSTPLSTPWWKRAVDICGAGTGLLLLSPVFLAAGVTIKLNSRGPVFFKQTREGIDGKYFRIWKFRTMRTDAESMKVELLHHSEQDGPAFKIKNDPRITLVGKYLRRSCVDELPQLFNVLLGDMSLVGPRPLPVNESLACQPWQRQRLRVLPGLTGVWQVDGGLETKFDDWMRMDMQYLRRRSFVYDLKLIFRTAFYALMHRGSV